MMDFYVALRAEVGQGQEIPLWGGAFFYRTPVFYYQKVSLDLRPATGAIFIFFLDKLLFS